MARRIALTVIALLTVFLGVVVLPLGLLTAAQDHRDFADQTAASAATLANLAEERLDDGVRGPALSRSVRELAGEGDRVAVYDSAGRLVAGTGGPPPARAHVRDGAPATLPHRYPDGGGMLVTAPVIPDSGRGAIGTVALSRSTGVDRRVAMLWLLIGAVSAAGLATAAVIAVGLARWVSRPLTAVADAARELGDGALATRAQVDTGPPEVRRLSVAFNTMAGRLESLVHGHQMMIADVSHQVRTPLAALRLRLDLLAQDADEATATDLAGAQAEVTRLSRLVSGLLAVARAENVTAAPVPVDLAQVIGGRAAAWGPAAEERGVTLRTRAGAPAVALLCDGHLEQILDNLLANALDALPDGGTVALGLAVSGRLARVTVADDGRGMTEQQQRTAFRRFGSAAPPGAGMSGGTGLGLAIVDRLVVANGGAAALSATPGGGLTITVELPLADPQRHPRRPAAHDPADLNRS